VNDACHTISCKPLFVTFRRINGFASPPAKQSCELSRQSLEVWWYRIRCERRDGNRLQDHGEDASRPTTVYFAPTKPDGVNQGNWIQTVPNKGYNVMIRIYSPLEPFFAKTRRPSEVELVR